jgi:hypothetical protein
MSSLYLCFRVYSDPSGKHSHIQKKVETCLDERWAVPNENKKASDPYSLHISQLHLGSNSIYKATCKHSPLPCCKEWYRLLLPAGVFL